MRRKHYLITALFVLFISLATTLGASSPTLDASGPTVDASGPTVDASGPTVDASGPTADASPGATPSTTVPPILVIATHGSLWHYRDDAWRYPVFKEHEESFYVIKRVPLDRVLHSFPEQTPARGEALDLSYHLEQEVADALIFDLTGTTEGYDGLRSSMSVTDPDGVLYRSYNHLSERSLHIDQPVQGEYHIRFYSDLGATFALRVGTGQSPFLADEIADHRFLFVPDVDPLTDREIASAKRFMQAGGKMIVIADTIDGPSYRASPNVDALNDLVEEYGIQLSREMLTTTHTIIANKQPINVLTHIVPHEVTQGITQVLSTGSVLVVTGTAEGLVFDDAENAAIAVSEQGLGQCLVVGTGIGFNSDFGLRQNDPLAVNIMQWTTMIHRTYLPRALQGGS